jgi:hypothetical protein
VLFVATSRSHEAARLQALSLASGLLQFVPTDS